ncbi:MAG: hypothetical protein J6X54_07025 [Treponema sp.]|nr:hypothetical protein [Treponema sp.]
MKQIFKLLSLAAVVVFFAGCINSHETNTKVDITIGTGNNQLHGENVEDVPLYIKLPGPNSYITENNNDFLIVYLTGNYNASSMITLPYRGFLNQTPDDIKFNLSGVPVGANVRLVAALVYPFSNGDGEQDCIRKFGKSKLLPVQAGENELELDIKNRNYENFHEYNGILDFKITKAKYKNTQIYQDDDNSQMMDDSYIYDLSMLFDDNTYSSGIYQLNYYRSGETSTIYVSEGFFEGNPDKSDKFIFYDIIHKQFDERKLSSQNWDQNNNKVLYSSMKFSSVLKPQVCKITRDSEDPLSSTFSFTLPEGPTFDIYMHISN